MPTKAELEQQLADLQQGFDLFKERVKEVAGEAKIEEAWCDSGFNRAMRELGLLDNTEVEATVTVTFNVVGTVKGNEVPDKEEVQNALTNLGGVGLTDEWSDIDVTVMRVECTDVGAF